MCLIRVYRRSLVSSSVPPRVKQQHHKTLQAATPGIPLAPQLDTSPRFLAIKLPDLSGPTPSAPVQVPYVPDFWNSAQPKPNLPVEPESPKVHVVSGSATHYDGGPTHNLEKLREDGSPSTAVQADDPPAAQQAGFWADFRESLGLPRSFSPRRTLSPSEKDGFQARSGPLTDEERIGLYVLLGILGGSWLVGGLVN